MHFTRVWLENDLRNPKKEWQKISQKQKSKNITYWMEKLQPET